MGESQGAVGSERDDAGDAARVRLAAFAEYERNLIKERVVAGVRHAQAKGGTVDAGYVLEITRTETGSAAVLHIEPML